MSTADKLDLDVYNLQRDLMINGYTPLYHCRDSFRHTPSGEKIYEYIINEHGTVMSSVTRGKIVPLKHMFFDKARTNGPVVSIRITSTGKRKNMYVKHLVYTTFGDHLVDMVRNGKCVIKMKDGEPSNVSLSNLIAVPLHEARAESRKPRNKFATVKELPKDASVYSPEMCTIEEVEKAYFFYNGMYHKVNIFKNNYRSDNYGILGLSVKEDDVPKYYKQYIVDRIKTLPDSEGKLQRERNKKKQSLPLGVILMHELYNTPRPGVAYNLTYKDGNTLNLSKDNIAWELPVERYKRVDSVQEGFLLKEPAQKHKAFYERVEKAYFLEDKSVLGAVKELGLDNKAYAEIYFHIKAIREGAIEALSEEVRNAKTIL